MLIFVTHNFFAIGKEDAIIKELLINEQIREKQVRLLDESGEQLGIKSGYEALDMARQMNLDLVLISPGAKPPVCKIMNYSKFRYEAIKREKEMKKNQKVIKVKEITLSITIGEGDFQTKVKNAIKFLTDGDKVKVAIRMKGRENAKPEYGMKKIEEFFEAVKEYGQQESKPALAGRMIMMTLAPITKK